MDSGLRVHFVLVHFVLMLAPMVSIVLGLQTAVHPSQLAPAVREVQGVAPVVRISHGTSISRWRLIGAVIRSPLKTPLQQVGRLMRPALNPTDTARCPHPPSGFQSNRLLSLAVDGRSIFLPDTPETRRSDPPRRQHACSEGSWAGRRSGRPLALSGWFDAAPHATRLPLAQSTSGGATRPTAER